MGSFEGGPLAEAPEHLAVLAQHEAALRERRQGHGLQEALERLAAAGLDTGRGLQRVLGYRRRPRRWLRAVLVTYVASFVLALTWAGAEEALWRRRAPMLAATSANAGLRWADHRPFLIDPERSRETVFVHRCWPFSTHTLHYDPRSGRFGGYD